MANNNVDKHDAIRSLRPDSQWIIDNDVVTWISGGVQPTEDEITAERTRLQDIYDAKEYARNRANEYPSIGDQLDMIYHNGDGGATFQAAIKAVKDKYPKE